MPLTPGRSVAVDRLLHTFGTPFYIDAPSLTAFDGTPFRRLMIAQDTGSAITGPARGDLFAGSGDAAGEIAGVVRTPADFYALLPRRWSRAADDPGGRKLSDEDRILWAMVARTAKPLKGKPPLPADEPASRQAGAMEKLLPNRRRSGGVAAERRRKARPGPHHFDQPTRDKLSKGRLPIEARVDLHGMTQGEAHGLLFSFLHRAHAGGLRYVLVITGKGSSFGSDGVLKRAVPAWLSTPPFRPLVSSHDHAARQHGGAGAHLRQAAAAHERRQT